MTGRRRTAGTKTSPSTYVHQEFYNVRDDSLLFVRPENTTAVSIKKWSFATRRNSIHSVLADVPEVCSKYIYLNGYLCPSPDEQTDDCSQRRQANSKAINQPYRGRRRYLSAGHIRQILTASHGAFISRKMYSSVRFISWLLTRNYSFYFLAVLFRLAPKHYMHVTNLIFVFPCIIIYGFIKTSLMQIV